MPARTSLLHRRVSPLRFSTLQRSALPALVWLALLAGCDGSPAGSEARACGEGSLRLDLGEAMDVAAGVPCELRAQDGARYVLAAYDAQLAVTAQTGVEPYRGLDARVRLQVTEGDGSAPSETRAGADASVAHTAPDIRVRVADGPRAAAGVVGGERPWSVDDVIRFGDPLCGGACTGRVARIVDGWLVLALDASTVGADEARVLAAFDEIVPLFRQHSIPLLQRTFTANLPVTSRESGQLVVLFRGDVSPVSGMAAPTVYPDGTSTHAIVLEVDPGLDAGRLLQLLTHEVAHTFQYAFMGESGPPGAAGVSAAAQWGVEGGASLIETEMLRRATGRAPDGNVDFRAPASSPLEERLFRTAIMGGTLAQGYAPAASFLDDQVARRMAAGDPAEVALREVLRGAMEGWYGVTGQAPGRNGLAKRMSARIPGWTPTDAVLTWTLSAGADDLLDGGVYQNRAWLRVGEPGSQGLVGWPPFREIVGGSNRNEVFSRPAGSSTWLLLRDTGVGITVRVAPAPNVHWKLLRIA